MNSLPLDTWIRLIDWMAIGLVIYFAYSYTHSHLNSADDINDRADDIPADYKPPFAALLAILLAIGLTIYQVLFLIDFNQQLKLAPGAALPAEVIPINLAIRLFAWVVTGVLVYVLMYGSKDRNSGRSSSVRNIGLIASLINLAVWGALTWWIFTHPALHGA